MFQFVKSAKWKVGEESAFAALDKVHAETGAGGPVEWHKMGEGWSWTRKQGTEEEHAEAAAEGWREIARRIKAQQHDLYVLDEFTYPMHWGWVDVDEVVATLRDRPGHQHVVITGRYAPDALIDAADLVMRDDQDQAPDGRGPEGPARHRVVSAPPRVVDRRARVRRRQDHGGDRTDGRVARQGKHGRAGKVGPDYIDPGYHALATGRPGRNLDPVLVGEDLIAPLFLHAAADADIAVIEGVMGLFDGRVGTAGFGSTAHVATLLGAPVLLVVDARGQGRSLAALLSGFRALRPRGAAWRA